MVLGYLHFRKSSESIHLAFSAGVRASAAAKVTRSLKLIEFTANFAGLLFSGTTKAPMMCQKIHSELHDWFELNRPWESEGYTFMIQLSVTRTSNTTAWHYISVLFETLQGCLARTAFQLLTSSWISSPKLPTCHLHHPCYLETMKLMLKHYQDGLWTLNHNDLNVSPRSPNQTSITTTTTQRLRLKGKT